ncbi:MAG: (Fe-S)-binding protein [Dechloromonas sp.]|nr:(Fe-S)-binding protein [Dechloromonas sp.]
MRIALYVTCLVDLMRPAIGFASLRLLALTGAEVVVPPGQTCCGQPAWSEGDRPLAAALARQAVGQLLNYDVIVVPSGSCAEHIVHTYPQLLSDEAGWRDAAQQVAGRTRELASFLAEALPPGPLPGHFAGTVTYHDSCKGLRGLGIKQAPRDLLLRVNGLNLQEMADCEACCGFGGSFSVRFAEVSTRIVDRKCAAVAASACGAVVGGDLGCLLNIEGRLRRRGDETTRVLHLAEVLAGGSGD